MIKEIEMQKDKIVEALASLMDKWEQAESAVRSAMPDATNEEVYAEVSNYMSRNITPA